MVQSYRSRFPSAILEPKEASCCYARWEVKQKIFYHLLTAKAVGKGTGLGLAIARQIVLEKHSGMLEVNSTLGVGTEFTISIPY
jgi:nitrogen-specific signal transduction histidine kinase